RGMIGVDACDQLPAFLGQVNYPRPTIGTVGAPLHQPFCLQPVNGNGNRTARQQDLSSDLVNRKRALVQQSFQHGEVAAANLQLRYTLFGIGFDRTSRLPQHQENVNATSTGQRFKIVGTQSQFTALSTILTSRYFKSRRLSRGLV